MTFAEQIPVLAAAGIRWDSTGDFSVPCRTMYDEGIIISYYQLVPIEDFAPFFAIPFEDLPKNLLGDRIRTSPDNAFSKMLVDRGF
jgi:hypothetical protein